MAGGSLSPVCGCDKNGPAAVINSAVKCDMMGSQSTLPNMKFSAGVFATKEGRQKFAAQLSIFFAKGGAPLKLNILNREISLDFGQFTDKTKGD